MSKQFKLVDNEDASCSKKTDHPTNWKLCVLCQKDTSEPLQCPVNSTRSDVGAGYKYVAENLLKFQEIDSIPSGLTVKHLSLTTNLVQTLHECGAAWHKSCRNQISNARLERAYKRKNDESQHLSPVKTRRSSSEHHPNRKTETVCIFCDQEGGSAGLHKASTFGIDQKVRKCATELRDTNLLAKLAAGDMVALDAQYHTKCLAKLYKRAELSRQASGERSSENMSHGIAFAELVSHIETFREMVEAKPVFKMQDLRTLYVHRLHELGFQDAQVHTTRLKERILSAVPDLRAQMDGREVLLAYDQDIGAALKQACKEDFDADALVLANASKIIRRDIFKQKQNFNGRFPPDCQEKSVPSSLTALVNMILTGPDIKEQTLQNKPMSCASKTISQIIAFNSVKSQGQKAINPSHRHNRDRETPVAIYLALKIHGETRKRSLVDSLYNLGLCISYDRVLAISTDVANRICDMYDDMMMRE